MAINETIYLHRNHRVCVGNNGGKKVWNRYSYWTHASDVAFDDGTTLESKISSIKGISNDINSGDGYAADISLVRSIRDSLKSLIDNLSNVVSNINNRLGGLRFYEDSNGKWVVGADSVPKKLGNLPRSEWTQIGERFFGTDGFEQAGGYLISESGVDERKTKKVAIDYNIQTLYPDSYNSYTADDFDVIVTGYRYHNRNIAHHNDSFDFSGPEIYSYNADTGILTVACDFYDFDNGEPGNEFVSLKVKTVLCR